MILNKKPIVSFSVPSTMPTKEDKTTSLNKLILYKDLLNFKNAKSLHQEIKSSSSPKHKTKNKVQMFKEEMTKYFKIDNLGVRADKPRRVENLGYKMMMKRLKKGKDVES